VLRYLPEVDLLRVQVARTELGIASSDALDTGALESLRFVNRPKGSAARVFLDAWLEEQGIDADRLTGYEHEVRTPGAVAAAVSNGFADAGVCPAAMAREAGLRFTPLGYETCDLLIREELAGDEAVARLIQAARSPEFQEHLQSLKR
jgi:putative molybdopterin biosynthesis protein